VISHQTLCVKLNRRSKISPGLISLIDATATNTTTITTTTTTTTHTTSMLNVKNDFKNYLCGGPNEG